MPIQLYLPWDSKIMKLEWQRIFLTLQVTAVAVWVEMGIRKQVPIFYITVRPSLLTFGQVSQHYPNIYKYSENQDLKSKLILLLLISGVESQRVIIYIQINSKRARRRTQGTTGQSTLPPSLERWWRNSFWRSSLSKWSKRRLSGLGNRDSLRRNHACPIRQLSTIRWLAG